MLRKLLTLTVVASLLVAGVTPAAATLGSSAETPPIVTVGTEGHPTHIVELANESDSVEDLRSWADDSNTRSILAVDNDTKTATVAAPKVEISGRSFSVNGADVDYFGGTQLAEESFVESVSLNYRLAYTEPVTLRSNQSWETPTVGITAVNDPDYPLEGVAFIEDAERTTMTESRVILGVDNVSADTSNLTIAVVDTGANVAASKGTVFGNGTEGSSIRISNASKNFLTNTTVNESGWSAISDGSGHGTWVLSAAIADVNGTVHDGMAPNATGLVLKALDDDGQGSTSDIAAAIRYAADHDADVISLSLGSPVHSEAVVDATRYAIKQGSVVVVAAGNSRASRSPGVATPADVPGVITVGATNGSEARNAWSAYFSQTEGTQTADGNLTNEEPVDVVAPGMKTLAKAPTADGFVENSTLSGTSMATPEVAGGILLAMASNATLASANVSTVHDAVATSARPTPHMAAAEAGNGMFAADNLATGTTPETSQSDSMTDPAQQRQEYYEAASSAAGGWLANVANRTGV